MGNNKNKKSVKFQGDMLNFCDFIQVFVFTRNLHLNIEYIIRVVALSVLQKLDLKMMFNYCKRQNVSCFGNSFMASECI